MSVRNELETLLSISQGTAEDYNEYLLRVLEEINAVEDSIFNSMSKDSQNWVNDGILAYNGNQPILEFPKVVQNKVGPERPYRHIVEPETIVEESIKDEPISMPEQIVFGKSIFEHEPELKIPDELQSVVNTQFENILEQISSPEIEAETQENIEDIGESTPEYFVKKIIASDPHVDAGDIEEITNHIIAVMNECGTHGEGVWVNGEKIDFKTKYKDIHTEKEDSSTIIVKKKRGRKPGTKNKPKDTKEYNVEESGDFTPNTAQDTPKKKRGRPKGTKNKSKDIKEYVIEESGNFISTIVQDIPKKKRGRKPGTKNKPKVLENINDISSFKYENKGIENWKIENKDDGVLDASLRKYGLENSDTVTMKEAVDIITENIPIKNKSQKPLDIFRILVCQNYDKPFEEIFKLAENQSIDIKKPTALVTCLTIKATINTLKNLGMIKEFLLVPLGTPANLEEDAIAKLYTTNYDPSEE